MRIIIVCLLMFVSNVAMAKHFFKVCYHNNTSQDVTYDNDNVSHLWGSRGEVVGKGTLTPSETKCFNTNDETLFRKHFIIFGFNSKWYGLVNAPFTRPYVVAQDANSNSGGFLIDETSDGIDNYQLHLTALPDGTTDLRNGSDISNRELLILPRVLQ
jgi:hypothetical protein